MHGAEASTEEGGCARPRNGWASTGYPEPKANNEAGVGRDDSQSGLSKGHPESTGGQPPPLSVTGDIGLSVLKAMEVSLTSGSQSEPEALCLSHHSLSTWHSPLHPSAPAISAGPCAEQMPVLGFAQNCLQGPCLSHHPCLGNLYIVPGT